MADTLLGGIVINEVLVDPNSAARNFDTDGNGTAAATDEFVEIANVSGAEIDISGLQLWDAGGDDWFTFPDGTVLQPGARAVVVAGVQAGGALPVPGGDDLAFDAGRGTAVLNNGGDNIVLYDPGSDTFVQATYNGVAPDDPVADYAGFSPTATRIGAGDDLGTDIDGASIQRNPDGSDTLVNDQTPTPGAANVCFTTGTLIQTRDGFLPVQDLRPGDMVHTRDDGLQPIRWIGRRAITRAMIQADPGMRPVLISRGALGCGLPRRDLRVSPQHRILVRGPIANRMFEAAEVLAPARHLIGLPGIDADRTQQPFDYIHIMFDCHQVIYAEGASTESLFTGPQALRSIDNAARDELFTLFPMLAQDDQPMPPPARRLLTGSETRALAKRHARNSKPLFLHTF